MPGSSSFIIAARRAANGRVGGLHRQRRIEDLAGPVIAEALADSGLGSGQIAALFLGNTTAGNNPARLAALTAGLGDGVSSLTIDRQEASGLEAIIAAHRAIAAGDIETAIAGGAEALSMAPWRIAKPRGLHMMPRFIGMTDEMPEREGDTLAYDAANALALRLGHSREALDRTALHAHARAMKAQDERAISKEIVALRNRAEEIRDELVADLEIDALEDLPPFSGDGTATSGNVSALADGAAGLVLVSEAVHRDLGAPAALRIVASRSVSVSAGSKEPASLRAALEIADLTGFADLTGLGRIELGEASAAEELAFRNGLGTDRLPLNVDGGQLARGQPIGAAGAVLLVRLFSAMVRSDSDKRPEGKPGARGLAVIGSPGGQALAVLVERV